MEIHLYVDLTAEELGDLNAATVSLFHLASLPTLEKAVSRYFIVTVYKKCYGLGSGI